MRTQVVAALMLAMLVGCGGDPEPTCGPGTQLVSGACIAKSTASCGPGTVRDGGVCQLVSDDATAGGTDASAGSDDATAGGTDASEGSDDGTAGGTDASEGSDVTTDDTVSETSDISTLPVACTPVCSGVEQCVDGVCVPLAVPAAWGCAKAAYAAGDNCDCGCGAPDPDCVAGKPVVGCATAASCNPDGTCPACAVACTGKQCGPDGCGGLCGNCGDPAKPVCIDGVCQACTPDCSGKDCGDDGCGGSCGTCGDKQLCKKGVCSYPTADESCLGHCGGFAPSGCACTVGCAQVGGCCVDVDVCGCQPDCGGKTCGDDGCGGVCGVCSNGTGCAAGTCVMTGGCNPAQCNGHGTCAAGDAQCTCQAKYAGAACDKCVPGLVAYPACVTPCTGDSACDDGNGCTIDVCASNQACVHPAITCDDGNGCTDDACDSKTGCSHKPNAAKVCNDGNACTTVDTCNAGACVGVGATNCDDGNSCSDDTCQAPGGCIHSNHDGGCDDGSLCSVVDVCVNQACIAAGSLNCDDGNACTTDLCNGKTGACSHSAAPAGGVCDDDDLCSQGDTCDGKGGCQPGAKVCALGIKAGLVAHFSAAQLGTLAFGEDLLVQSWQDQSGQGHELSAAKADLAPKLVQQAIHGRRGVRLTGASGLKSAAFGVGNQASVFAVVCTEGGGPGPWLTQGTWSIGGSTGSLGWSTGAATASVSVFNDLCYVLAARAGGGKLDWLVIDSATTAKTETGVLTAGPHALTIGATGSVGVVGELLVYDHALTDDERDAVTTYLRTAWGFDAPTPNFVWYDAGDSNSVVHDAAGAVKTWHDKSGLGRDAQVGKDTAPVWFAKATGNGKPAIRFDGGSVRLQTAEVPTSAQLTVFTVLELDKPQSGGSVLAQGSAFSLRASGQPATGLMWQVGANKAGPTVPLVSGAWQLVTAVQDGKSSSVYAEPKAVQKLEQPAPIAAGNVLLQLGNSAQGNASMGGFLAEVRAYSSALSRTDRAFIEAGLKVKYGL